MTGLISPAWLRRVGAALALGAAAMLAWSQELSVPAYAPLVDPGAVLNAPDAADIVLQLRSVQAMQGTRIAVLIVPTTRPEDLQSYANRVGNAWKLGRRDVGDGVLVVLATQDRAARIEVARSLEGAIPDLEAKRILHESMSPRFAQGDFHGGLRSGIERIAQRAAAEGLAPPSAAGGADAASGMSTAEWVAIGLIFGGFGFFMLAVVVSVVRGASVTPMLGRWIAASLGTFASGIVDAATLKPFGPVGAGAAAALTAAGLLWLTWRLARHFQSLPSGGTPTRRRSAAASAASRRDSSSNSSDSGGSSDSSSSSSSSSSSDSGGGGDFGGGGSSDSY